MQLLITPHHLICIIWTKIFSEQSSLCNCQSAQQRRSYSRRPLRQLSPLRNCRSKSLKPISKESSSPIDCTRAVVEEQYSGYHHNQQQHSSAISKTDTFSSVEGEACNNLITITGGSSSSTTRSIAEACWLLAVVVSYSLCFTHTKVVHQYCGGRQNKTDRRSVFFLACFWCRRRSALDLFRPIRCSCTS